MSKFWDGPEQRILFVRWRTQRDISARDKLIEIHHPLAVYLARKFDGRGEPLDDLIQVAVIGLILAVDRFDPDRGVRFASYATPTIVGEIRRHFRDKGYGAKMPRRLQELGLKIIKAKDILTQRLDRTPTIFEIAEFLQVSIEEASEAASIEFIMHPMSLDSQAYEGSENKSELSVDGAIGTFDPGLERIETRAVLKQALRQLDEQSRNVITLRYLHDFSQAETARRLKISQMHVSRLQHRAIRLLQEYVGVKYAA